ncbi:hypothetical protein G6F68_016050 [Rhizopus microsporus]|nr:hypothetical protein G6F68_016050 [Rhizopus microsporus]
MFAVDVGADLLERRIGGQARARVRRDLRRVQVADIDQVLGMRHHDVVSVAAGAVHAHRAAQQALDALRCDQAHLYFVQADGIRARRLGAARHHPVVAAQRQHAPAGRGVAGDRGHHRDAALGQRAHGAEEGVPGVQQLVLVIAVREQVRHVHATARWRGSTAGTVRCPVR